MLDGGIDIHAHILPQTDDGAESFEEAMAMIEMARAQGISHIIATPHFQREQETEDLRQKAESLQEEIHKRVLDVQIRLGQEIQYFEELPIYLEKGKALTMAGSRYVLVEFMPGDPYSKIERGSRQLIFGGYLPVIAHAERCLCLHEKERLKDLIHSGALIQMNYRSLEGGWMNGAARWCRKQVIEGRVHFLGTDMHNMAHRPPQTEKAEEWICRHCGRETLEQLTRRNPQHILEDKML